MYQTLYLALCKVKCFIFKVKKKEKGLSPSASTETRNVSFEVSGTSKFSAAEKIIGQVSLNKEVLIRKTLAYGTRYGLGVFCLLGEGDVQIGWVPEKDQVLYKKIEALAELPNFHAKIYNANKKTITERFCKIKITVLCTA